MTSIGHNRGPKWDAEIERLMDYLRETPRATFLAVGKFLNMPVSSQTYVLRQALARLEKEGIVFKSLPSIGYQRHDNNGVAGERGRGLRKTARAAKRALGRTSKVDQVKLPPNDRLLYWARGTVLQQIAKDAHGNSINARVRAKSLMEDEMERLKVEGAG